MKLKVMLPTRIMIEEEVDKISAEAVNGSFTLLPRHIDFLTALLPGILAFEHNGSEEFLAVDQGLLVKIKDEVLVTTRDAVRSRNLDELKKAVDEQFAAENEQERQTRTALAKLESEFIRQFLEFQGP
jgi:F-type H+-transporting ATPase subunit epsilon